MHAAGVARWTETASVAGEGDEAVGTAVSTADADETMAEQAGFEISLEGVLDESGVTEACSCCSPAGSIGSSSTSSTIFGPRIAYYVNNSAASGCGSPLTRGVDSRPRESDSAARCCPRCAGWCRRTQSSDGAAYSSRGSTTAARLVGRAGRAPPKRSVTSL